MKHPATRIRHWRLALTAGLLPCLPVAMPAWADSADTLSATVASPEAAPAYAHDSAMVSQGRAAFLGSWLVRGHAGEQIGLGPLFNARSCNTCHAGGGGAQGPTSDGIAPVGLVVHLAVNGTRDGDPTYGQVLNTSATDGASAEGAVYISYTEKSGYYYPFGTRWVIRVPHYHLTDLTFGPLAPSTVIKPRIAPSLFGVGVLESLSGATPAAVLDDSPIRRRSQPSAGHLGWQRDVPSIRDQTALALATDIGVTSPAHLADDCTPREDGCGPTGSEPTATETTAEVLDALVAFQRSLPPPMPPVSTVEKAGAEIFVFTGCAACHLNHPVAAPVNMAAARVTPYTDMQLHHLGASMDDETVAGARVVTLWRTAPLWGIAHRLQVSSPATFLHDGRARTTEEAVLWHGGEAAKVTRRFMQLSPGERGTLLAWLDTQ